MNPYYFVPNFTYYPSSYPFFSPNLIPNTNMYMFNNQNSQVSNPQGFHQTIQEPQVREEIGQQPQQIRSVQSRHRKLLKRQSRGRQKASESIELQNRNILPNMNNVLLSYTRRISRSGTSVEKVIRNLSNQCTQEEIQSQVKKFYAYQNYIKNNVNDFIIREAVRAVMNHSNPASPSFSHEEQHFFNKVFRIVVRQYLQNEYLSYILCSVMGKVKRRDHLKVRRYMLSIVKG